MVLLIAYTTHINNLIAEDVTPLPSYKIGCTSEVMVDLVTCYANKYHVPYDLAHYIVKNESHYNPNNVGDLNIICKRTGEPVYARGLMQITRCYYPNVTDEQAFDPYFNLDFGMKLASKKETCISQFSTCRNYYNRK